MEIKDLTVSFKGADKPVLNHVNVDFPDGQLSLLQGPSGCGKSTLTLCLNGLIPHEIVGRIDGSIRLFGSEILGKTPKELSQKVGVVFQDPETQFCTYTVFQEIAFGLENIQCEKSYIAKRVPEVLELVGMKHMQDAPLNQLSGGEKQKIAIAAVLAPDPLVILFDEPTANMDPQSKEEIFALIRLLRDEAHKTIIVIEHQTEGLLEMTDFMAVVGAEGTMLFTGRPRDYFASVLQGNRDAGVVIPQGIRLLDRLHVKPDDPAKWLSPDDIAANLIQRIRQSGGDRCFEKSNASDSSRVLSHCGECVSAEKVQYAYGSRQVLQDICFKMDKKEFVAIVGPNGAGKSTLLYLLLHLKKDYTGTIRLGGKDVRKYSRRTLFRKAGMVFQNPEWQFITYKTVDEIYASLKSSGVPKQNWIKRAENILGKFHLYGKKEDSPFLLSQGQKRRLSVASMMVVNQEIMLLDEPTFGQDYQNRLELMEQLKKLNAEGVTILMVTHDIDLVAEYCSRVLVLSEGTLRYDGDCRDLFQKESLIRQARITKPYWLTVSESIQREVPSFPDCISLDEVISVLKEGVII